MELDVLIFYEHPARELESCHLLGAVLRESGLSVEIRSIPYQFWEARRTLRPRAVVSPWTSRRFFNLKSPEGGVPVLLDLHQEQIGDGATEGIYQRCEPPFDRIFHAAWGKRFREGIIRAGMCPDHVFLTGYPRLDFYRPEFAGLSQNKEALAEQFGLDPEKRWVLLISSFAAADLSRDDLIRFRKKGFYNIEELAQEAKQSREVTMELLRSEADRHGEMEFIYRPHPAERSLDALLKGSGVKIIRKLDIRHWFLNGDLALIWNSTSCIEAYLAGIPFFKFRPRPMDQQFEIPTMRHAPTVTGENLPQVLNKLESADKKALFDKLSGEYDQFREDLSPNYEIDHSAIETTAATVFSLLSGRVRLTGCFDRYRYSEFRVAWEGFRTRIRDRGIRSGWLPSVIRRYQITGNDMPSATREENILKRIVQTVDLEVLALKVKGHAQSLSDEV